MIIEIAQTGNFTFSSLLALTSLGALFFLGGAKHFPRLSWGCLVAKCLEQTRECGITWSLLTVVCLSTKFFYFWQQETIPQDLLIEYFHTQYNDCQSLFTTLLSSNCSPFTIWLGTGTLCFITAYYAMLKFLVLF